MKRFLLPLGIFLVLVVFLGVGLNMNPREIPSPLIGKPAPAFELAVLGNDQKRFTPADMRGKVWVFNVWASWCAACREEHPHLMDLANLNVVPIIGLDFKDKPDQASAWLLQHGNPYLLSVMDPKGQVGIDYGVYGVPETFVIDREGLIRYKHIGPITADALQKKILPLVNALNQS
jgi:cytochrome c biogenesis protein CcmG, thiol:disulfide interchange protein DsbE